MTAVADPRTRRTGRHRNTRPRTLHLLDVENLLGGRVCTASVRTMWTDFVTAVDARWDDLSTVAVARRHAATTFFALPDAVRRVVGGDGPDGADLALIESVDVDWVHRNFGRVVIASGDHIFTGPARQFSTRGLEVVQVIGDGRCSAELYRACTEHRYLPGGRRALDVTACA